MPALNITLLTYGSRGDVQPFIALAIALQRAGHRVRLAAPHRFADLAAEHYIPFAPLPGEPEEISRRINDATNPFTMFRSVAEYIFSIAGDVARAAFAACDDADVIVHSYLFTTGAHSLARSNGIPDVSVQFMPMFAPTRAFSSPALPDFHPGALSYFSHWLLRWVFWHAGNFGYAGLRRRFPDVAGLQLHWPFDLRDPHPSPLLFAYSPSVLLRPNDWTTPNIHVVGYLALDTPASYEPPRELTQFLQSGKPPICVTFGSMVNQAARRVHQVVLSSLERTGERGIVLRGWGDAGPEPTDGRVHYLDSAPHDWLFPRCKLVVHHGGAGTAAAALRAGVPSVIVPHGADQSFWGRRIAAIGAAPAPIPVRRLSVERLLAAIDQASQPVMRERAQALSRQLCAEDGAGECVRIIEEQAMVFKTKEN